MIFEISYGILYPYGPVTKSMQPALNLVNPLNNNYHNPCPKGTTYKTTHTEKIVLYWLYGICQVMAIISLSAVIPCWWNMFTKYNYIHSNREINYMSLLLDPYGFFCFQVKRINNCQTSMYRVLEIQLIKVWSHFMNRRSLCPIKKLLLSDDGAFLCWQKNCSNV